jgi:hypothetical protein
MEILLERLEHEAASGRVSVDLDAEVSKLGFRTVLFCELFLFICVDECK